MLVGGRARSAGTSFDVLDVDMAAEGIARWVFAGVLEKRLSERGRQLKPVCTVVRFA